MRNTENNQKETLKEEHFPLSVGLFIFRQRRGHSQCTATKNVVRLRASALKARAVLKPVGRHIKAFGGQVETGIHMLCGDHQEGSPPMLDNHPQRAMGL